MDWQQLIHRGFMAVHSCWMVFLHWYCMEFFKIMSYLATNHSVVTRMLFYPSHSIVLEFATPEYSETNNTGKVKICIDLSKARGVYLVSIFFIVILWEIVVVKIDFHQCQLFNISLTLQHNCFIYLHWILLSKFIALLWIVVVWGESNSGDSGRIKQDLSVWMW